MPTVKNEERPSLRAPTPRGRFAKSNREVLLRKDDWQWKGATRFTTKKTTNILRRTTISERKQRTTGSRCSQRDKDLGPRTLEGKRRQPWQENDADNDDHDRLGYDAVLMMMLTTLMMVMMMKMMRAMPPTSQAAKFAAGMCILEKGQARRWSRS